MNPGADHNINLEAQAQIKLAIEEENQKHWGKASRHYHTAISLIDQQTGSPHPDARSRLPEPVKDQALVCWLGYFHCRLIIDSNSTDANLFDIDASTSKELKKIEREIRSYRSKYVIKLWNILHEQYSLLETECRKNGMNRAANLLYKHSMGARLRLYYWLSVSEKKNRGRSIGEFLNMLASRIITGYTPSPWRPVLVLVFPVIFVFTMIYLVYDGLMLSNGAMPINGLGKLLYYVSFSTFTFTGAGPGDILPKNVFIETIASLEVIFGYVITVVALGYLFNQNKTNNSPTYQSKCDDSLEESESK